MQGCLADMKQKDWWVKKFDELNLDDSIDVEIVAVRVYAEDEFEDELAEFWRRQFFEQQD